MNSNGIDINLYLKEQWKEVTKNNMVGLSFARSIQDNVIFSLASYKFTSLSISDDKEFTKTITPVYQ